jgi:antitoxin ParD1/3/4
MAPTPSLNVSLTAHLGRFIADMLASGRYQSASEVVRAALRLLEKSEAAAWSDPGDGNRKPADGLGTRDG